MLRLTDSHAEPCLLCDLVPCPLCQMFREPGLLYQTSCVLYSITYSRFNTVTFASSIHYKRNYSIRKHLH